MKEIEGWFRTTFGDIAALVKGISYTSEDYCNQDDGAVFVTIKCVSKSGGFNSEGIKYFKGTIPASQVLQPGELLIANTDLTRAGDIIGCPILVPMISEQAITMSMDLSKVLEDCSKIHRGFLYYKLMTDTVRRFMRDHASGSTVLHLHTRAVPDLELEIPTSILEQAKIAEILSTVDRAIEQTEALIAKQQRIKTGLMQDLLTRGIDEQGNLRSEETHEFKDSPLGRIPVEWEVKLFDEVIESAVDGPFGSNLKTEHYVSEPGVRVLRLQNIGNGEFLDADRVWISIEHAEKLERHSVCQGDLLIASLGDEKHPFGRACLYELQGEKAIVKADVFRIRCKSEIVNHSFIFRVFNLPRWRTSLLGLAQGVTRDRVNLSNLRLFKLPIPPIREQFEIAARLDPIDDHLQAGLNYLDKLRSLKTALMQDLLTGKVRVTSFLKGKD